MNPGHEGGPSSFSLAILRCCRKISQGGSGFISKVRNSSRFHGTGSDSLRCFLGGGTGTGLGKYLKDHEACSIRQESRRLGLPGGASKITTAEERNAVELRPMA